MGLPDSGNKYATTYPEGGNSWRTGFKWVSGIFFTLTLIFFLTSLTLFQTNSPAQAKNTISELTIPLLSDSELAAGIAEIDPDLLAYLESPEFANSVYEDPASFRQMIDELPQIPGAPGEELNATLYTVSLAATLLGKPLHDWIGLELALLGALVLAAGAALVLLCRGLGRLSGPGACIAIASWLPLVAAVVVRSRLKSIILPEADAGMQATLKQTIKLLAESLLNRGVSLFGWASLLALVLLLAAAGGYLLMRPRGY